MNTKTPFPSHLGQDDRVTGLPSTDGSAVQGPQLFHLGLSWGTRLRPEHSRRARSGPLPREGSCTRRPSTPFLRRRSRSIYHVRLHRHLCDWKVYQEVKWHTGTSLRVTGVDGYRRRRLLYICLRLYDDHEVFVHFYSSFLIPPH